LGRVALEHVTKRFGDVVAVDDLTLEIDDREFLILLGPSGCGKSTALRMIAGLEDPTEGIVRIGDRIVNDVEPKDRDVAMVFQSYALYPHMTVRRNIEFPLRTRRIDRADRDELVLDAAETLDLTALLDRKPAQLSGGQRQRVALARAIVRRPQAFLMDEPLSNLDAKLRVATRAELVELHHRLGITVVYVTHDQVEAMTMGSRIAVLDQGALQPYLGLERCLERLRVRRGSERGGSFEERPSMGVMSNSGLYTGYPHPQRHGDGAACLQAVLRGRHRPATRVEQAAPQAQRQPTPRAPTARSPGPPPGQRRTVLCPRPVHRIASLFFSPPQRPDVRGTGTEKQR
jgi:ABC-type nitrate/sulfonate/bicarbonate transport system ATPase subunit